MLLYLRQQGQLSRKGLAEFGTFIKVRKLQERYNFMLCGVEIRVDHNCVTVIGVERVNDFVTTLLKRKVSKVLSV